MEVYLVASGASAKDGKVQTTIILNCAGPQVLEVYDNIVSENPMINISSIRYWKHWRITVI